MPDPSDRRCACCEEPLERVRYFQGQLLGADDMRAEQAYFREKARRHNLFLHGWGVVCGCSVEAVDAGAMPTVRVRPGYAIGPQGDEIAIDRCVEIALVAGELEAPCATAYVAVRYAERLTRPVPIQAGSDGVDETGDEYSRASDSYEIAVLRQLPQSHLDARRADAAWRDTLRSADPLHAAMTDPVPPCPERADDPWVVLATVTIGASTAEGSPGELAVSFVDRRVVLSTERLQAVMRPRL